LQLGNSCGALYCIDQEDVQWGGQKDREGGDERRRIGWETHD